MLPPNVSGGRQAATTGGRALLQASTAAAGEAELAALKQQQSVGEALEKHPSLLRLRELARNSNARIYSGFAKHAGETA